MNTSIAASLHCSTRFSAMRQADLIEVIAIERFANTFPWRLAHFEDALHSGYAGICMRATDGELRGYCVLMPVVDEMHLLNLCIAPATQGTGAGLALLDHAVHWARDAMLASVLLEVGASNQRALRLYQRFGFAVIGCRKNYYVTRSSASIKREDALVMRFVLPLENMHDTQRAN